MYMRMYDPGGGAKVMKYKYKPSEVKFWLSFNLMTNYILPFL